MRRQNTYRTDLTLGHLSQTCKFILDILSDYQDETWERLNEWELYLHDYEDKDLHVKTLEKIISDIEQIKQSILNGEMKITHENPITKITEKI